MSSPSGNLKVAIYARVSSKKKVAYLQHQIEMCKKMIELKGGSLYRIYRNKKGVSGRTETSEREEYQELRDDFKKGCFNTVVFYSFDRLGTDARIIFNILGIFQKLGIKYMSCKENIDFSPQGEMMTQQICYNIQHAKDLRLEKKSIKKHFKKLKKESKK